MRSGVTITSWPLRNSIAFAVSWPPCPAWPMAVATPPHRSRRHAVGRERRSRRTRFGPHEQSQIRLAGFLDPTSHGRGSEPARSRHPPRCILPGSAHSCSPSPWVGPQPALGLFPQGSRQRREISQFAPGGHHSLPAPLCQSIHALSGTLRHKRLASRTVLRLTFHARQL